MNRKRLIEITIKNVRTHRDSQVRQSEILLIKADESRKFENELMTILDTPEQDALREPVADFAKNMEARLARHDEERGPLGWRTETIDFINDRLSANLNAVDRARINGDSQSLIDKCADSANMLMMLADLARIDLEASQG